MVFLANIVFNFHSGFSITLTFLLVNVYLMQNMKKKNIEIAVPLFFHNIGPNLAQILLQRPHPLYLFWLIFNEICQGIQLILITSVAIQQFWKKLVKPLKNCFFGPNLHRKGVIMGHTQDGKFFFLGRNNKSRSSVSRESLFYQNIICFDLWIFFYLE